MNQSPFTPGPTVTSATVSGTSQALALGAGAGAAGTPQVLLTNLSAAICFIKFGASSAVTAAVTDTPILPNAAICMTPPVGTTHIAVIGASGVLYATVGHGVIG